MCVVIEMIIEKAKPLDLKAAREICIKTANDSFKGQNELVTLLYCDYYFLCQPDLCFVLRKPDGRLAGYVLGAGSERYIQEFNRLFGKKLRKISLKHWCGNTINMYKYKKMLKKGYDYHLHIDIVEEHTGAGYGKKLMDALIKKLRMRGAGGIYLGVASENERAIKLYKKCGFVTLKRHAGRLSMGLKFN